MDGTVWDVASFAAVMCADRRLRAGGGFFAAVKDDSGSVLSFWLRTAGDCDSLACELGNDEEEQATAKANADSLRE